MRRELCDQISCRAGLTRLVLGGFLHLAYDYRHYETDVSPTQSETVSYYPDRLPRRRNLQTLLADELAEFEVCRHGRCLRARAWKVQEVIALIIAAVKAVQRYGALQQEQVACSDGSCGHDGDEQCFVSWALSVANALQAED